MNEKRLLDQSEIFAELSKVLSLLSGDLSYDKRAEAKKIVGELLDASRESTVKESVQFITVDLAGDETKAVENEKTCNEWKKDIDTDRKSILVKAVDEWFGCIFG